jgi:putative phosphoribosyl transferase
MFADRLEAGEKLAFALQGFKETDPIVLAIPAGGIEIGYVAAKRLGAELSVIISKKLPFPYDTESGFGAVAEDGGVFIFDEIKGILPEWIVAGIIKEVWGEVERDIFAFGEVKPFPVIRNRTVIICDDGIATGATMRAAIMCCRRARAKRIIAAVPVAGRDHGLEIRGQADELVVLETPENFRAVEDHYAFNRVLSNLEIRGLLAGGAVLKT